MRKLIKKVLAPLVRQIVQEELSQSVRSGSKTIDDTSDDGSSLSQRIKSL